MNIKKYLYIGLILFMIASISGFAKSGSKGDPGRGSGGTTANGKVRSVIAKFEAQYPQYSGKVTLTGGTGERTWQEQMRFILERPRGYPNISKRFASRFSWQTDSDGYPITAAPSQMTKEMLQWWEREIMAQAGKPDGFAHIGGKAQDVWVAELDNDAKRVFESIIKSNGLGIIYEKPPKYYVSLSEATVFHCYVN